MPRVSAAQLQRELQQRAMDERSASKGLESAQLQVRRDPVYATTTADVQQGIRDPCAGRQHTSLPERGMEKDTKPITKDGRARGNAALGTAAGQFARAPQHHQSTKIASPKALASHTGRRHCRPLIVECISCKMD